MNPDTITQSVQKGFRTTLGAASFMVDLVQHPEQRDENLNRLKTDLNQLVEEWAVKGETTEQEARVFVDNLLKQSPGWGAPDGSTTAYTRPAGPSAPANVQADLKELTAQIAALRAELEALRQTQD